MDENVKNCKSYHKLSAIVTDKINKFTQKKVNNQSKLRKEIS